MSSAGGSQSTKPLASVRLTSAERSTLLWLGDALMVGLAVVGALGLWTFTRQEPLPAILADRFWWIPSLTGVWVALAWAFDLYNPAVARQTGVVWARLLGVAGVIMVGYLVVFFAVAPQNTLIRLPLVYFLVLAFVGDSAWRWGILSLHSRGAFRQRTLIVGAGWAGQTISRVLREQPQPDFEVVGFVDDAQDLDSSDVDGIPVLGTRRDLEMLAADLGVSVIIYAITHDLDGDMFQRLMACQTAGLTVVQMPALYEDLTGRVPVDHLRNEWLLPNTAEGGQVSLSYRLFTRVMDLLFSLLAGVLLVALWPLTALLIKLDSSGPVLYCQQRSGRGGVPFRLLKFRSMVQNAEDGTGAKWASEEDPRITHVGKILRRTRLDELPQILNILRGDMHLIGPRPERPEFIYQLEEQIPFYRARLMAKPGLTGWAQVNYRYGNTVEDARIKLEYDLYYIKNRSPLLDIQIMLKTLAVMVALKGT
jgi:exopolysaccharide biosynthesis polyprenyl glycosylphosphotransferase